MTTHELLEKIIEAAEKAKVDFRSNPPRFSLAVIEANTFIQALKDLREQEQGEVLKAMAGCSGQMVTCEKKHRPYCDGCFSSCPRCKDLCEADKSR